MPTKSKKSSSRPHKATTNGQAGVQPLVHSFEMRMVALEWIVSAGGSIREARIATGLRKKLAPTAEERQRHGLVYQVMNDGSNMVSWQTPVTPKPIAYTLDEVGFLLDCVVFHLSRAVALLKATKRSPFRYEQLHVDLLDHLLDYMPERTSDFDEKEP